MDEEDEVFPELTKQNIAHLPSSSRFTPLKDLNFTSQRRTSIQSWRSSKQEHDIHEANGRVLPALTVTVAEETTPEVCRPRPTAGNKHSKTNINGLPVLPIIDPPPGFNRTRIKPRLSVQSAWSSTSGSSPRARRPSKSHVWRRDSLFSFGVSQTPELQDEM